MIGGVYRIGQVIASGGMLTRYTAYNHNTNDVVGLDVIDLAQATQGQEAQQLLQPLERYRSLQSAHVLRVYDWGIEDAHLYIATDPPRGVTLRHVLDTEDIDLERALTLVKQLARGLKVLHEHSIAGIDLRPQLITVDVVGVTDRVQIDDIGLRTLLRALGGTDSEPEGDIAFLDPRYAPPEYINGTQVGPWSDIYQLGLLVFDIVTGRPPFVGRNHAETGVMQNSQPVPRMVQYKHSTPEQLQRIVDRALAKNPAMRFPDADALLVALDMVQPSPRLTVSGHTMPPPGTNQLSRGLTREMHPIDGDIALVATQLEGHTTVEPQVSEDTGGIEGEGEVYAYLAYEKKGAEKRRLPMRQKSVVIGRSDPKRNFSPNIDLSPLDPQMTVSRQHARLRFEETFFYIEDLKSRNKTRLGELVLSPLKPELVQHGDILCFGSVRMRFELPGMPEQSVLKETT